MPEILRSPEELSGIDETPALDAKYQERRGFVMEELAKISPQDFAKTKENIRKAKEIATDEELLRLYSLEKAIDAISSLKVRENKQDIIDNLAKRQLFELDDASKLSGYCEGELGNAVFNLNEAVYALARVKFPEDVKKQVEGREREQKEEIERMRTELMKKSVE